MAKDDKPQAGKQQARKDDKWTPTPSKTADRVPANQATPEEQKRFNEQRKADDRNKPDKGELANARDNPDRTRTIEPVKNPDAEAVAAKKAGPDIEANKDPEPAHTDVKVHGENSQLPEGHAMSDDVTVKIVSDRRPWFGGKRRAKGEEVTVSAAEAERFSKGKDRLVEVQH